MVIRGRHVAGSVTIRQLVRRAAKEKGKEVEEKLLREYFFPRTTSRRKMARTRFILGRLVFPFVSRGCLSSLFPGDMRAAAWNNRREGGGNAGVRGE